MAAKMWTHWEGSENNPRLGIMYSEGVEFNVTGVAWQHP